MPAELTLPKARARRRARRPRPPLPPNWRSLLFRGLYYLVGTITFLVAGVAARRPSLLAFALEFTVFGWGTVREWWAGGNLPAGQRGHFVLPGLAFFALGVVLGLVES